MPIRLSGAQIESYGKDGFCSPIDVMPESEATDLRLRLEDMEARFPDALNPLQRNNTHLIVSVIDEITHHPVILDAVEDIIGPDIMVHGSVLFIKEAGDPGFVSWHQDATYMGLEPHDGITAWLALSPSTRESGCMSMLPGTHRDPIRDHKDTFGENNILTRGQAIDVGEDVEAVDLVLRPGQMSLHHPRVIHASQPNASDHRRIGVVIQQYLPHHVRQIRGQGLVQCGRGAAVPSHYIEMPRPQADMEPDGIAWRERVNGVWSDILYDNADQKRAY